MGKKDTGIINRIWTGFLSYAVKFGVVGLIGFGIDIFLFNALILGFFGFGVWWQTALGAKFLSTSVAIIANWIGNRFWTFRHRRRTNVPLEFIEYVIASLAGMVVTLFVLWISHDVLGLKSLIADNVSANVIGLGLGTLVRFALYRFWIWGDQRNIRIT